MTLREQDDDAWAGERSWLLNLSSGEKRHIRRSNFLWRLTKLNPHFTGYPPLTADQRQIAAMLQLSQNVSFRDVSQNWDFDWGKILVGDYALILTRDTSEVGYLSFSMLSPEDAIIFQIQGVSGGKGRRPPLGFKETLLTDTLHLLEHLGAKHVYLPTGETVNHIAGRYGTPEAYSVQQTYNGLAQIFNTMENHGFYVFGLGS